MDSCQEVFALLSQYLDRELPADVCQQMSTHIEKCAPCVEFVDSLKRTVALCHEYRDAEGPAPMPEDVRDRLLEAYRKVIATAS